MFLIKPKWNIVYKYLKKKTFFQETQISFPKCIEHKIFFDIQLQLLGLRVSLNYPILNFKKTVCPKNVWM